MEMPAVTVGMLTVHDDSQTLFEALKVGAQGYLMISGHTAKNHMKSILAKLHLHNRHQAAAYGVARGWLPRPKGRG
jgi:DNA-binding NarL/FixJ family response regulator